MRWTIITLAVCACAVRVPRGVTLPIQARATVRVDVQTPPVQVQPAPVAIVNAPVVEFFGIPLDDAQDIVFVLDVSGSMDELAQGAIAQIHSNAPPDPNAPSPPPDPNAPPPPPDPNAPPPPPLRKIDIARSELVDALERLAEGTRMNVIFFNSELDAFSAQIAPLDEPGRASLITFVKATEPVGSTALAPAMRTAFLMNAHRIVLLSDGLGNVGGNAEAVLRDAREAMHGGVRIDTIGLGASQDVALLNSLARESGGLYQAF